MGQRGKAVGMELRQATVREVVEHGRSAALVARMHGVSRQTVWRWVKRYGEEGEAGLVEGSRRPRGSPRRADRGQESTVLKLQRERAWGAGRTVSITCGPGSAV